MILLNFDFKPDVIIDGILGTGISGEIREPYASAINYINHTDCYKFAVDVPSGLGSSNRRNCKHLHKM